MSLFQHRAFGEVTPQEWYPMYVCVIPLSNRHPGFLDENQSAGLCTKHTGLYKGDGENQKCLSRVSGPRVPNHPLLRKYFITAIEGLVGYARVLPRSRVRECICCGTLRWAVTRGETAHPSFSSGSWGYTALVSRSRRPMKAQLATLLPLDLPSAPAIASPVSACVRGRTQMTKKVLHM